MKKNLILPFCIILSFVLSCSSKRNKNFTDQVSEDLVETFDLKNEEFKKFKVDDDSTEPKPVSKKEEKSSSPVKLKKNNKKKDNTKAVSKQSDEVEESKESLKPDKKKTYLENLKDYRDRSYPEGYPEKLKKYTKKSYETWKQFKPVYYPGEEFTISVRYLGITAGNVVIGTRNKVRIADEPAYVITAKMKSAKFYEYIYALDDKLESIIQKKLFLPAKYTLLQRETNQKVDDLQLFDTNKLKTFYWYKRIKKGKLKKDEKKEFTPKFFQDSFSALYFVRGLPLQIGDNYKFPIMTRAKMWVMELDVVKKEEVKIMGKWVNAIKIKAETHYPGVLKKKGDINFWYSDDKFKKLLKFEAKVKIGAVEGILIDYKDAPATIE